MLEISFVLRTLFKPSDDSARSILELLFTFIGRGKKLWTQLGQFLLLQQASGFRLASEVKQKRTVACSLRAPEERHVAY
jgi:hypothetical protein